MATANILSVISATETDMNLAGPGQPIYIAENTERWSMASRGRPRSFDRNEALVRVMEVFWAKGYEGAQLNDLVEAIGIKPPSFYAAFGSKEAAFRESIELYLATVGARVRRELEQGPTAYEGIQGALAESVNVALSSGTGGCFLILGLVNCLPENEHARACLAQARQTTITMLHERLERGVREGDLPGDTNVELLANFYNGVIQAISFQARDGAVRSQLMALIEPAMKALETCPASPHPQCAG